MGWSMDPGPCFVYVRILVGQVDIPISCSGCHLELEKQWRVGASLKSLPSQWEEGRKIGEGGGGTPPHPLWHSCPNSPSLQQIQNGS